MANEMLRDLTEQFEYLKTRRNDAEQAAVSFEKRNIGADKLQAQYYRGKMEAYDEIIEFFELYLEDYNGTI